MNKGIEALKEVIATDIIGLAQSAMEGETGANTKVNRNTLKDSSLYKSVKTEIQKSDDVVINALFQHYINYIEWDRPPEYGNPPPIDVIIEWAKSKGISTDNNTVYAIRYAIWRDGHDGRPVIEMFNNLLGFYFGEHWAEEIFDAITDELTKFFN